MKKIYILSIFAFLSVQFISAQNTFEKDWKAIEHLEFQGKSASAHKRVKKIYKKANRKQNAPQIIKSFIYDSKFTLLLNENAESLIFEKLQYEIEHQSFPTNAILESVYAEFLFQYYKKFRTKIYSRSYILTENTTNDYRIWDAKTFLNKIHQHYQNSIQNEKLLQNIPIEQYTALLKGKGNTVAYRSTLYDVLAHNMMKFYNLESTYNFTIHDTYKYDENVFRMSDEFVKLSINIPEKDEVTKGNTLRLFQKLEKLHRNTTAAHVDILLQRLKFVYQASQENNRNKLYINALKTLAKNHQHTAIGALVDFEIAKHYISLSLATKNRKDPNYKNLRIKAHELATEIVEKFPKSEASVKSKLLLQEISKQMLSFTMEKNSASDVPSLLNIRLQGIDTIQVKIYQTYAKFDTYRSSRTKKEDLIKSHMSSYKPFFETSYTLNIPKDYYTHTTEISIPKLPIGEYLVVLSNTKEPTDDDYLFSHLKIKKTNLVISKTSHKNDYVYTVTHRTSGAPIANAKFDIKDDEHRIYHTTTTDKRGIAHIRKEYFMQPNEEIISFQKDSIITHNGSSYFRADDDEDEINAKSFIFMDRSIYRPGQTIYFKGIVLQEKNNISSVVPNIYCNVIIEDSNSKLKEFRLKTNEYGSFNGSYKLPKTGQTGEYYIIIEEDADYEEDEHPFWDFINDFEEAEHPFYVEEYKRPRFEIQLDPITENFKLNDSVTVSGKAKALLGSTISNADVKYTITRDILLTYDPNRPYSDNNTNIILEEATVKTDAKGHFKIPFLASTDSLLAKNVVEQYTYEVEIEIIDLNGEVQTAEQDIRIGYDNFEFDANIPIQHTTERPLTIELKANDLNESLLQVHGEINIYKLKKPARTLQKRPWGIPSKNHMSKEIFINQFPHLQYDTSENEENWEKETKLITTTFDTKGKGFFTYDVQNWESGTYIMEVSATDDTGSQKEIQTQFTISNKNDASIPTNELFAYKILNTDFAEDGYIQIKLLNGLPKDPLHIYTKGFYKGDIIYDEIITVHQTSKTIKIPVRKDYNNDVDVKFNFVKFNAFYQDEFMHQFQNKKQFLQIETASFRNKLMPGKEETWKFKILDQDKKGAEAELLASMYDESLDQFKPHSWNIFGLNPEEETYYVPYVNTYDFGNVSSNVYYKHISLNSIPEYRDYIRFNWFGMNFNNSKYNNVRYLRELRQKRNKAGDAFGNISGIVLDDTGLPLPGATVMVKGTRIGATTDFDGLYTITATASDILHFSYVGFTSEEVRVGGQKNIIVNLESNNALDEVIIVAYGGAVNSAKVASAIATVNGEEIQNIPIASLDQILQGQAAGVSINTGNGATGSGTTIIIRGQNTLNGSNKPLYIIDGVIVDEATFQNLNQGNVSGVSILKDTAATAIYGNRGANGVVIITTKYGTRTETIDGKKVIIGLTEDDINTVVTRKKLDETAFFYPQLQTDKEGNISFTFNSPEALTRWKLQLFAHNKNGAYGITEKTAVTQKELMVIPNMPRFFREKDTIVISSKVVSLLNKPTKGIASLQLFNALTMEPIDAKVHQGEKNKAFTIDAKGNTNLSWKLYIPEGIEAIQYKVIAKAGNFSDGEENALPVLTNRMLVTEAKPFWVKAGDSKKVTFSNLASNTSESLQQHKFTLEYTSNPAWSAIKSLPYLMEYPYECAEQSFARYYANALATHVINSSPEIKNVIESWKENGQLVSDLEKNDELKSILISETPWIRDAVSEDEKKQRFAKLFDPTQLEQQQAEMLLKLRDMQKSSGGFPWFAGGRENPYITLHILQIYAHLQKLNIKISQDEDLDALMKKSINYVDTEFLKSYQIAQRDSTKIYPKSNLKYLFIRLALAEKVTISEDVQKAMTFYTQQLQDDWISLSLRQKTAFALTLERQGNHKMAKKIMISLDETAVKTEEKGMYWKENINSWYYTENAVETHALIMEAFHEIMKDETTIAELQLWLLSQKRGSQWSTTKATTEAIYALLLSPNNFTSIKDNTVFKIGDEKIKTKKLKETEKEAGTGYFKTSWNKEEITTKMATVHIRNKSKSVGYGGLYWQYFEDLDKIKKSDASPLNVTKELFTKKKNTQQETLIPIKESDLKIGDVIVVRLTINNENPMSFIHLKDMRAAGLEPLNVLSEYKWQDGVGYFESTRDTSTHFFMSYLPKGVFIIEYEVRVNNLGEFSNGITTIENMYAPEFRSHTKGIRIKINAE